MFGGGGCGWRRERLESVTAGTGRELDQVRMMKLSFLKWANAVVGRLSVWGCAAQSLDVARAQTHKLALKVGEVGLNGRQAPP